MPLKAKRGTERSPWREKGERGWGADPWGAEQLEELPVPSLPPPWGGRHDGVLDHPIAFQLPAVGDTV